MPLGILNPGDNPASTVTRPPHVNTDAGVRKWWSNDDEGTLLLPQDLNALMGQLRSLGDFYGVSDVEGDDTYTRRAIQAALASYAAVNFIENAAFEVAQRPSPWVPLTVSAARAADRWVTRRAGVANATVSKQGGFSGAQNCLRIQRDVGTSDIVRIDVGQQVPTTAAFALAGKNAVLSFDVRTGANYSGTSTQAALVTGTGITEVFNCVSFPTGNAATTFTGFTSLAPGASARMASLPLAVPSGATELGIRIGYTPTGTAGAADYLDITNVQLEAGFTASTFTPRPASVVHDICRWYFERIGGEIALTQFGYGMARNTLGAFTSYNFAPKRAIPVITVNGPTNFSVLRPGGISIDTTALVAGNADTRSCRLDATVAAGLTSGEAVGIVGKTTASYIDISAEI